MKPLRRKKFLKVTDDLLSGQERILESSHEHDNLSDDGSVDSIAKQKLYFADCGCAGPVAGCCSVCGALSCDACHGRCQRCARPTCLECSAFVEPAACPDLRLPQIHQLHPLGSQVRLCSRCARCVGRKRLIGTVARLVLAPFLKEPTKHGP